MDRLQTTSHLLFIHGLFNNSFSYSDHMSKNMVISEQLIWKDAVVTVAKLT